MRQDGGMDLLAVLGAYPLQDPRVVCQFESYGNDNWLVEDEGGGRYVLRRHRLNGDAGRLEFQLALQAHLAAHGVPTAPVVRTRDGRDRVVDDEGVPWLLTGFVEGEEYDFGRPAQAEAAGALLARFHEAAAAFAGDAPGPEHKPSLAACWAAPHDDLEELGRLIDGDVAEELRYLRARWTEVLGDWPWTLLERLPSGCLHGDFHGRNVIYAGDEVAGLLDFDDVDRGPYAYDVAGAAVKFGREGRGSALGLRPAVLRRFLDGYESVRVLTAEERSALPVFAVMLYPPNPRHYRWWRDQHGQDLVQQLRDDVWVMRTLEGRSNGHSRLCLRRVAGRLRRRRIGGRGLAEPTHATAQRLQRRLRELGGLGDVDEVVVGGVVDHVGDAQFADGGVHAAEGELVGLHGAQQFDALGAAFLELASADRRRVSSGAARGP